MGAEDLSFVGADHRAANSLGWLLLVIAGSPMLQGLALVSPPSSETGQDKWDCQLFTQWFWICW